MTTSAGDAQRRIDRLFDRFERMTDAELVMLRVIWDQADAAAREDAWQSVKAIVRKRGLESTMSDARARLAAWVNNNPFTGIIGSGSFPGNTSGMNYASVRQAALPPMLDAVAAAIATDALDPAEATALLEPITNIAPHGPAR